MRGPTQPITTITAAAAAAAAAALVFSPTIPGTDAFSVTNDTPVSARALQTSLHSSLSSASDPLAPLPAVPATPARQQKKKLKTYQRYLEIACWKNDDIRDLQPVLQAVGDACKQISRIVQRAQTDDLYGAAVGADGQQLDENVQGEVQQKLDVVCNNIMLKSFCGCSSSIAAVASEEEDLPRTCCDVMVS
jgi:fructose-1,6-bisphosphatase I